MRLMGQSWDWRDIRKGPECRVMPRVTEQRAVHGAQGRGAIKGRAWVGSAASAAMRDQGREALACPRLPREVFERGRQCQGLCAARAGLCGHPEHQKTPPGFAVGKGQTQPSEGGRAGAAEAGQMCLEIKVPRAALSGTDRAGSGSAPADGGLGTAGGWAGRSENVRGCWKGRAGLAQEPPASPLGCVWVGWGFQGGQGPGWHRVPHSAEVCASLERDMQ